MIQELIKTEYFQITCKLVLSLVCCGLVGYEREVKHKSAGLRTCMSVGLATTLAMILTLQCAHDSDRVDLTRLASGCVQGLGFLGAGIILHKNDHVEGLTTAAVVWSVAILGLVIGYGLYFVAILFTILLMFTAHVIPMFSIQTKRKRKR